MYCILMDSKTKCFYMEPGVVAFHAFSDASKVSIRRKNARIVETDIEDINELDTLFYNAGFVYGYLDGKERRIMKGNVYFYDKNPNEIAFSQYLLTKDTKYLSLIKKPKLITLCRIDGKSILFPTVEMEDGSKAVLTYTDYSRMPANLLEKYSGWKTVQMSFNTKCMVNGEFIME